MSIETYHTPSPDQESQLSKDQQAWIDNHNAMWGELKKPYEPANHDKTYSVGDFTFEPITKGEHPPIAGSLSVDETDKFQTRSSIRGSLSPTDVADFDDHVPRTSMSGSLSLEEISDHNEKQEAKKKGIRGTLGALATKIANVFRPKTSSGELSEAQVMGQAEAEQTSEKQPRFDLVDIKAKALKIVDKTKYNAGLAKEIGGEVKDILAEKTKEKLATAKDRLVDAKDDAKEKAIRAKDISVGFAQSTAYEGLNLFATLPKKAIELAKNAPSKLSERYTDAAPTSSNPNNRELNRRGKILVVGLGVAAYAAMLYLGAEGGAEGSQNTADLANQVPLDTPGIDGIDTSPDTLPRTQLSVSPDSAPDAYTPEPTHADLTVDFSPEIGTLEAGDNIWDDSMKMLKEGGFDGPENDLVDRTNLLTDWRLKEMGITPEQAKYLPVDTELPMPEFTDIQEIITKVEQLKR